MKRYRVKTAYLDKKIGEEVVGISNSDSVALQAGFLEEVKEDYIPERLARIIVNNAEIRSPAIEECLPAARSILTYLRSKMPRPINFTDDFHAGYNYALREVLREVFGEMDCKGDH